MQLQDLILVAYFLLFNATVIGGITGPRHTLTHLLIVVTALFTPFISFDLSRLGDVPLDAWIFCAAFLVMQAIHTAFHVLRPHAIHAHGPEILFQPMIVIWVVALRYTIDPALWYRGNLGLFFFCLETLFLSLGVLMLNFIAELTSLPGDDVDVLKQPLSSKANAGFLTGVATTLMLTLFVVFGSPLWLLGATIAFTAVRMFLGPRGAGPRIVRGDERV